MKASKSVSMAFLMMLCTGYAQAHYEYTYQNTLDVFTTTDFPFDNLPAETSGPVPTTYSFTLSFLNELLLNTSYDLSTTTDFIGFRLNLPEVKFAPTGGFQFVTDQNGNISKWNAGIGFVISGFQTTYDWAGQDNGDSWLKFVPYGQEEGSTTSQSTWLKSSHPDVTVVPEPDTYAMVLAGLGMIGFAARRRRT